MPTRLLPLAALACFAAMTTACATRPPSAAPLLTLPDVVREPCPLPILPPEPTQGDLDATYMARGAMLRVCDGRRDLAVQSFDAQQRALTPTPRRSVWRFLMGG